MYSKDQSKPPPPPQFNAEVLTLLCDIPPSSVVMSDLGDLELTFFAKYDSHGEIIKVKFFGQLAPCIMVVIYHLLGSQW